MGDRKRRKRRRKYFRLTYFSYSLVLALFLTFVTFISTIASPVFDLRLIFTSIMYSILSFVFLISLALIVDSEKFFAVRRRSFFLLITLLYGTGYLWANISFILTNQMLRGQSLFFLYKIFPKTMIFSSVFIFCLVFVSFILIVRRRIKFLKVLKKRRRLFSKINLVLSFVLIGIIFLIPLLFNIFNPLVEVYARGDAIYIVPEKIESEKVLDIDVNLDSPNVVMILLESVSAERLGVYGYSRDVTPNIDKLANNGILFLNAYTTATHSDYAQPAYLSSRYMITNGYRNFFDNNYERKMAWELFDDNGYTDVYFSSQDDLWAGMNNYFNFDSLEIYSYSLTDGKTDYGKGLAEKDYDYRTTEKIVEWISNYNEDRPFFMYVNFQATHMPLVYPEEYAKYKPNKLFSIGPLELTSTSTLENRYDNALSYVDAQVGKIVDELKRSGKFENTIIVISSDHGHDLLARHGAKEGHGTTIYNEEIKPPLIFYIPGVKPERVETAVSHIDVLPTIADLLGFEIPAEFVGKPMMKDNRIFFYTQNHRYLIGMLRNNLKLIVDLNKKTTEAYDIESDPKELNNIIDKGFYDKEILELLLWDHCQREYFSKVNKPEELSVYCENF